MMDPMAGRYLQVKFHKVRLIGCGVCEYDCRTTTNGHNVKKKMLGEKLSCYGYGKANGNQHEE